MLCSSLWWQGYAMLYRQYSMAPLAPTCTYRFLLPLALAMDTGLANLLLSAEEFLQCSGLVFTRGMEERVSLLYVCKVFDIIPTSQTIIGADQISRCSPPSGLASQHCQIIFLLQQG